MMDGAASADFMPQRSVTAPTQPKKKLSFADDLIFHSTWPATVYDRRGEQATCNRLTPLLAQRIKEELNTYKMEEMAVAPSSRIYTHFFVVGMGMWRTGVGWVERLDGVGLAVCFGCRWRASCGWRGSVRMRSVKTRFQPLSLTVPQKNPSPPHTGQHTTPSTTSPPHAPSASQNKYTMIFDGVGHTLLLGALGFGGLLVDLALSSLAIVVVVSPRNRSRSRSRIGRLLGVTDANAAAVARALLGSLVRLSTRTGIDRRVDRCTLCAGLVAASLASAVSAALVGSGTSTSIACASELLLACGGVAALGGGVTASPPTSLRASALAPWRSSRADASSGLADPFDAAAPLLPSPSAAPLPLPALGTLVRRIIRPTGAALVVVSVGPLAQRALGSLLRAVVAVRSAGGDWRSSRGRHRRSTSETHERVRSALVVVLVHDARRRSACRQGLVAAVGAGRRCFALRACTLRGRARPGARLIVAASAAASTRPFWRPATLPALLFLPAVPPLADHGELAREPVSLPFLPAADGAGEGVLRPTPSHPCPWQLGRGLAAPAGPSGIPAVSAVVRRRRAGLGSTSALPLGGVGPRRPGGGGPLGPTGPSMLSPYAS
ncbi:hypothetical protein L1887_55811 [Cichorium endivia]|nr:hypothetical protein L1887_55811 [Cichorium endivia]